MEENTSFNVITKYGKMSLLIFVTNYYFLFVPITLKNHIIMTQNIIADYCYWLGALDFGLVLSLPVSSFLMIKQNG